MVSQIRVNKVETKEIVFMRDLYRQEMDCQIVHDSLHRRGFNDTYLIRVDGKIAGYGTVTSGNDEYKVFQKGILNEFYLAPIHRSLAVPAFQELVVTSCARQVMAQTNDSLLMLMIYDFAEHITSNVILFHDARSTELSTPDGVLRKGTEVDPERGGDWYIEVGEEVAAKGGYLTHYNPPYGDVYMEVTESYRRRGYGSYLVQELKRLCYEGGRRPSARCNASNLASRKTLEKAGFLPCARMVNANLIRSAAS